MTNAPAPQEREIYYDSDDGLRLFARDMGPVDSSHVPVLCLAGLTRNSRDFETIAPHLTATRRVIAPDYRGRGKSQHASDWKTYEPPVEMADAITLLDFLGIEKVALIGTSRGGLIGMLMGQFHKHRLAGVFLNDIGPKLEDSGLIEIARSIQKRGSADTWREVVDSLKEYHHAISGLSEAEWLSFAKRLYVERAGKIVPDYDHDLMRTFPDEAFIRSGRIPQAWELFDTLGDIPVGLARGEKSDLLSLATVEKMQQHHPGLIFAQVPGRAHVPFLDEPESVAAIDIWVKMCDTARSQC